MALTQARTIALGVAALALLIATGAYAAAAPTRVADLPAALAAPTKTAGSASASSTSTASSTPSASSTSTAQSCAYLTTTVPCHDPIHGWWNGMDNCYWDAWLIDLPLSGDPRWMGDPVVKGNLYKTWCDSDQGFHDSIAYDTLPPPGYNGNVGPVHQLQAMQAPKAAKTPVAPIALTAPQDISASPSGSTGLVGLPVWMWVGQKPPAAWGTVSPSPQMVGPTTLLGTTIPSAQVTFTARAAKVDWYMGEGDPASHITCNLAGAPFPLLAPAAQPAPPGLPPSAGPLVSPNCGYQYKTTGTFTVTAASTWSVNWMIGADAGTVTIVRSMTLRLKISELQVVVQ
jgi:hypothetical protein